MIYLYMKNKTPQNDDYLWRKTKGEYDKKTLPFLESLDRYIESSGSKNRGERKETSLLILKSLYHFAADSGYEKMPTALEKDPNGRPCFVGADINISISHSEDDIVICYSQGAEIGVDIEDEIDEKRAENLEKRFTDIAKLSPNKKCESPSEKEENKADETSEIKVGKPKEDCAKIKAFKLFEDEFLPIELSLSESNFTAKWTAAEAIMKCDGRGFSALPELDLLAEKTSVSTYTLSRKNAKAYVSIAEKN